MRPLAHRLLCIVVVLLCIVLAKSASAQSDTRTAERKRIDATMDPVLEGHWSGRGVSRERQQNEPGMRTDPQAIACMVKACRTVRAAFPNNPKAWRDSRQAPFAKCHQEHVARANRPGFVPLAKPPSMDSFGCDIIEGLRVSDDDRVYEAVNGRARPQPAVTRPVAVAAVRHGGTPPSSQDVKDLEAFALAPMATPPKNGATSAPAKLAKRDDNPYLPPAQPVVSAGTGPGGLGDKLELVYADGKEAAIRVLPGGQFYTIRGSWLAKTYDTDWKSARKHPRAMNKQFIGACFGKQGSVSLDPERMKLRASDKENLNRAPDDKFVVACEEDGGEYRFALQAGETIRLGAKSLVEESADSSSASKNAQPIVSDPVPDKATVGNSGNATPDASVAYTAPSVVEPLTPDSGYNAPPPALAANEAVEPASGPLGAVYSHDRTPRSVLASGTDTYPPASSSTTSMTPAPGVGPIEENAGLPPAKGVREKRNATGPPAR